MRFSNLGSGSSGNATLVEATRDGRTSRVLVDCGLSMREVSARLARRGVDAASLDAIFVTHEHSDHIGSALGLARRHGITLWMSRGTWQAIGEPEAPELIRHACDGQRIDVGALELTPYAVPHDAIEPLQLRIASGGRHLGILTDAGSITPHLLAHLQCCDALLLECNHDLELLAASRYPRWLKARIAGRNGHLSNHTSAQILEACLHGGLRHLVAAHLSRENNRPDLARAALRGLIAGQIDEVVVADPVSGCDWIELG